MSVVACGARRIPYSYALSLVAVEEGWELEYRGREGLMSRRAIIAVLAGCALLASCGASTFVGFVSNPGVATSVRGIVNSVKDGFISDPTGVITPFTAVTFINSENAITVFFCGDQQHWFPMGEDVRAEYSPGIHCNVLLNVVVQHHLEASASELRA